MEENSRVRITVLLDDKTLNALRTFMYEKNGTTNVSKAIMSMVKDYGQIKEKQ
jgi:hypothetical protein